ncbi:MAG: hypothetical protein M1358_06380 [Chloroflexi bacterium]|nr:hypothetical protein [Chloroflexota bacterium]
MGLSEAPFLAFLLLSLNGFMMWEDSRRPAGLVWAGVGAALAVLCRYEALAWVAVMAVAIAWQLCLRSHKPWNNTVVGSVVGFVTPSVWALLFWILMNWQITGSPVYFLVGPGSTSTTPDTAQALGAAHPFAFARGSLTGSAELLLTQIADLAPLLLPATALLVASAFWRRRWSDLAYVALGWSILAFVFVVAWRGILPPWTRYFFWIVPGGIIVAAATYRATVSGWPRHLAALTTALLLFAPTLSMPIQAWRSLSDPPLLRSIAALIVAPEVKNSRDAHGQLDEFVLMADYLNSQPAGTLSLIDASVGSAIVFWLDRPYDLVTTTDRDFFPILRYPVGHVDQVLVPFPSLDAKSRSEVVKAYPDLYEGGEAWAHLVREFPGPGSWRLYSMEPSDPSLEARQGDETEQVAPGAGGNDFSASTSYSDRAKGRHETEVKR